MPADTSAVDDFLTELLADGPVAVAEVLARAAEAGFSEPQTRRARARLGLVSVAAGFGTGSRNYLCFPRHQGLVGRLHDPEVAKRADERAAASAEARQELADRQAAVVELLEDADDFFGLGDSQRRFLTAYSVTGNITKSAKHAGITRMTVHRWRSDERFSRALAAADEAFCDELDAQLLRGIKGEWTKEVIVPGIGPMLLKVPPSERLLLAALRARRPAVWDRHNQGAVPDTPEPDDLDRITHLLFGSGDEGELLHDALAELEQLQEPGREVTRADAARVVELLDDAIHGIAPAEVVG